LKYSTSGKYFKDAESIWKNLGASIGYHAVVFFKLGGYDHYLRPELIYTQTKFDFGLGEVSFQRIDTPVLVECIYLRLQVLWLIPHFTIHFWIISQICW
jgi:hypothetical protein